MGCLDITTKLAMMIDSLKTAHTMLKEDNIRPDVKLRLEEDVERMKIEIKELYLDLYKIINN